MQRRRRRCVLVDAEASFQRREHLAALQREFNRLEALSAKDASGWDQRRRTIAACAVQAAWRRQITRRGFRRAVAESLKQRREHAASLIQHAQRTRRRVVHEAAAPIAKEEVEQLTRRIGARTLAMAQELQTALDARLQAQASGEPLEALPTWLDASSWIGDLSKVGGSALVHQLRDGAARGLSGEGDPLEGASPARAYPHPYRYPNATATPYATATPNATYPQRYRNP